jgi:hypothetical protein
MAANVLNMADVVWYVENNIGTFHERRLEKLNGLKLEQVLFRKNPYLFKAKNVLTSEALVKSILDAFLSSQEETLFGDFLEGLAVFVCGKVYGGTKPPPNQLTGIDLVFQNDGKLFIVEIKSGPHWGNSSQIGKMLLNFEAARQALNAEFPDMEIVAVNGCSYGRDNKPAKNAGYRKLCGQDFWSFISGNDELYTEIIEPLGHQAAQKNEEFAEAYAQIVNKFTYQFTGLYCTPDGTIHWERIVRLASQRSGEFRSL